MIKIKRNVKRGERRKLGIKRSSKVRREHGLRNFAAKSDPLRKSPPCCEMVSQPPSTLCENFLSCEETPWHTSAISQPHTLISQLRNGCEILHALKSFSAHIMKPYHHWTHFDHFLKFISYIPYSISKLGNSGVYSFKRCSI